MVLDMMDKGWWYYFMSYGTVSRFHVFMFSWCHRYIRVKALDPEARRRTTRLELVCSPHEMRKTAFNRSFNLHVTRTSATIDIVIVPVVVTIKDFDTIVGTVVQV